VRLYSAPHLHLKIVVILGIAAVLFKIMCHPPNNLENYDRHFPDASIAANQI
jgi:hypothetical protein